MTPEALSALRDRLIAATGPDRELDCAIAVTLDGFFEVPPRYEGDEVGYGYIDKDGTRITPGHGGDQLVREYTDSIDTALGLVDRLSPIGPMTSHELNHTLARDGEEFWNFRVKVYDVHDEGEPPKVHHGTAYTAPLAILIALVSALSQPGVQS